MSQQINLYNPLFLRREKYFSAKTMLQALGLIFLGVAGLYVFAVVQTRSSERVVQDYRAQVASQREQLVKLGTALSPQARSKALEADIARLEAEIKARRSMLTVLSTGELGNTEGVSPFFAAFGRQSIAGVPARAQQRRDDARPPGHRVEAGREGGGRCASGARRSQGAFGGSRALR